MTNRLKSRASMLVCTALTAAFALPTQAFAQGTPDTENGGLEEIIVTAQKREQSLQDVPIAVTAVTEESLQANRIFAVSDLSAVAPGLTVRPSPGGIQVPAFTIRGQVSYGVVAGSDKQVSIYLDGVYISSPRGSIFELPDVQRLEVLRGPQGTLFGRNATAGAVSITTRDPSGDARMRVEGSYGNYDAYRVRATVETPEFGPFSAYFSYVRNYRRGEIENAAAGLVWDRTNSPSGYGVATSARWLGTVDSHSYFAAVKFEPSDDFKMVYKFDRNDDSGTPEATAAVNFNTKLTGNFLTDGILAAIASSQNLYLDPSSKRPDIVSNGWAIPRIQRVQGHSLTSTWHASDSITVKDILAYRKAVVFAPSAIDGLSSLTVTPAVANAFGTLFAASTLGAGFFGLPPAQQAATASAFGASTLNKRLLIVASQAGSIAKQWSNELQINYNSEKLQATVGAIWFHSDDEAGGPVSQQNTFGFRFGTGTLIPQTGILPLANEGRYFNKATSLAAYAQLEYKFTPELEVVAGARITSDKKTSLFRWDLNGVARPTIVPPEYSKTKPNFLIGLNWKPNADTLVYGKYSTSFVSGGSTGGIVYSPETASSFEVGLKADLLDHKLRTNLSLFHVIYNHFQSPGSSNIEASWQTVRPPLVALYGATTADELRGSLSTFVVDQGKIRAQGFELEVTAAPARGLTLGSGVGYTDVKFLFITPDVLAGNGGRLDVTARPKWTVNLFGTYETRPLFNDTTLQLRMDGLYRSRIQFQQNPTTFLLADGSNATAVGTNGYMLVNGRVALRHLKIGPVEAELALWGKNITDRKDATFSINVGYSAAINFLAARTFGVDLNIDF